MSGQLGGAARVTDTWEEMGVGYAWGGRTRHRTQVGGTRDSPQAGHRAGQGSS